MNEETNPTNLLDRNPRDLNDSDRLLVVIERVKNLQQRFSSYAKIVDSLQEAKITNCERWKWLFRIGGIIGLGLLAAVLKAFGVY
jgi:hypothetical protein